jgi:hypothetical protein
MTTYRALTVRQPWAWAIVHGGKTVENRSGNVSYRGPLAIHAGKTYSHRGLADRRVQDAADRRYELAVAQRRLPTGAVVGVAVLVDVHPDAQCCRPWGESEYVERGGRLRKTVFHYVLDDIRPILPPVDCAGRLGLWRWSWNG